LMLPFLLRYREPAVRFGHPRLIAARRGIGAPGLFRRGCAGWAMLVAAAGAVATACQGAPLVVIAVTRNVAPAALLQHVVVVVAVGCWVNYSMQ